MLLRGLLSASESRSMDTPPWSSREGHSLMAAWLEVQERRLP